MEVSEKNSLDNFIQELNNEIEGVTARNRKRIIKTKLQILSEYGDDSNDYLTPEEWSLLKIFLKECNDCTSVIMQNIRYEDSPYDNDEFPTYYIDETFIRLGNRYLKVTDGSSGGLPIYEFEVFENLNMGSKSLLLDESIEPSKTVEHLISGENELTKPLDISGLFETPRRQKSDSEIYSLGQFIRDTKNYKLRPNIVLADGITMSVQASSSYYSDPRQDGLDSYNNYEVGYPSQHIEELENYAFWGDTNDPRDNVYTNVPAKLLDEIIEMHGGIDRKATFRPRTSLESLRRERETLQNNIKQAAAQHHDDLEPSDLGGLGEIEE